MLRYNWNMNTNAASFLLLFFFISGNVKLNNATSILAEESELECGRPQKIKYGFFRLINLPSGLGEASENLSSMNDQFTSESNFLSTGVVMNSKMSLFPEGSIVEYFCKPDFWVHPPSSSRVTCNLGKWLGDVPVCVAKRCVQPKMIFNGYYLERSDNSDNFYPPGARLQFLCHSGYLLKGPDMFICDDMGNWTPDNQPECFPSPRILNSKKCSVPPDILGAKQKLIRGVVGGNASAHGTVVEYRCRPGYRNILSPCIAHTLSCHQGKWRGTSPRCEEFSGCIAPPNIANGFMYEMASSYPLQSQVYYSCERGYRLMGPSVLTCEDTGCWTPFMPPICQLNHRFIGEDDNQTTIINVRNLIVAVTSGLLAVLFLLFALYLYHRAVSPKLMRLRSSRSGSELQPRSSPSCPPAGPVQPEHDPDRVALIAFPDEMISAAAQGVPPSYEEAVRQRPALAFDHQGGRFTPHAHRSRGHRVVVSGVRRQHQRDNPDNISYQSIGSARQSSGTSRSMSVRSWSACESLGSSDTVAISDSTNVTVDTMSSGAASGASGAASCRGLAGSRASFDTSSLVNNEDAPLLEEAESEEGIAGDRFSLSTRDSDSLKDNVSHTRSITVSVHE